MEEFNVVVVVIEFRRNFESFPEIPREDQSPFCQSTSTRATPSSPSSEAATGSSWTSLAASATR